MGDKRQTRTNKLRGPTSGTVKKPAEARRRAKGGALSARVRDAIQNPLVIIVFFRSDTRFGHLPTHRNSVGYQGNDYGRIHGALVHVFPAYTTKAHPEQPC